METIMSLLTGLVKPVLDGLFRWKEGEDKMEVTREQFDLMQKQLDAEIRLKLAEELRKPDSEFRSFMLDYEGKAEDQTPLMRDLRSSVRPVITYWALIVITAVMFGWVNGDALQKNLDSIPAELWQIFLAIFGFWFGGRALQQIAETWKKGDTDKQTEVSRGQTDLRKLDVAQAKVEAGQASPAAANPGMAPVGQPVSARQTLNPWDDQPW